MKSFNEAIRKIRKSAEQIKADPTIPEKLKNAFLDINRFLIAELNRHDRAQRILRSPYLRPGDLLARARAKRQVQDTETFARILKKVIDENDRKKIPAVGKKQSKRASATGKDQHEALGREGSRESLMPR